MRWLLNRPESLNDSRGTDGGSSENKAILKNGLETTKQKTWGV